jgi:hypothetical protein
VQHGGCDGGCDVGCDVGCDGGCDGVCVQEAMARWLADAADRGVGGCAFGTVVSVNLGFRSSKIELINLALQV